MNDTDNITKLVAYYGAALSTVTFLWGIYRDLRDRGKLKVNAYIGQMVAPGPHRIDGETYSHLCINIANVGRRPVKVETIGGRGERHWFGRDINFMVVPRQLPKMLAEGETLFEHYPLDHEKKDQLLKAITFGVIDSRGVKHEISLLQLWKLKRSLKTANLKPQEPRQ